MRRRWRDENSSKKHSTQLLDAGAASSILTDSLVSGLSTLSYTSKISSNPATTTGVGGSLAHITSPRTAIILPSPQTHAPLTTPIPEQGTFQPSASSLQRQDTFLEQPWHEPEEIINVTTRLPLGEEEPEKHAPPIWATPERYNLGPLDVFRSKRTIPETLFLDCISPYFRQSGSGFLEGLRTLHTYFVKMQGPGGESLKQEMGEITHEKFCEILKKMHNSIPIDVDRTSENDIKSARERYKGLYEAGGSHGIAISVLDSQQHKPRRTKRPAEEQNDGKVPKKKSSKTMRT